MLRRVRHHASMHTHTFTERTRRFGLGFVFLWFFVGGIAHFIATDLEASIVPPWVPFDPRFVVLASGVVELVGALALLVPRTRRMAGWLLVLLTIAVTPAHVYMLQTAERWPNVPYWALALRLPLQLALVALIVWSTSAGKRAALRDSPAGGA